MADPKVNIKVEVDGSQAAANLERIRKGLGELATAGKEASTDLGKAKKEISDVTAAAEKASALGGVGAKASAPLDRARKEIAKVAEESGKASPQVGLLAGYLARIREAALSIPGVGTALLAVGSAAAVAATVTAGLAKSLQEFANTEASLARLEAALANMGSATGDNLVRMKELADEMQRATGIADGEWLATITKLIQAGSTPESIGMDLEAVKNLTGYIGSLESATTLYARALQGNFEGFSRYGIVVEEAGSKTETMRKIQEQAAQRGAGVLEAATQTLSGQVRGLWNALSGAAGATGQWAARTGVVQSVLWSATEVLKDYAEAAAQTYDKLGLLNKQTAGTAEALSQYREVAASVLRITQESITAINAEVEAMRKKQSLLDQLTDKKAALKKSEIDLAVTEGRMSPQQAAKAKAKIDIDATKEKAQREIDQANLEEKKQQEKVAILKEQKDRVDSDLKREEAALEKDAKRDRIRQIVGTGMATMQSEEGASGAAALVEVGWSQLARMIPRRGVLRLLGAPEEATPDNDVGLWLKRQEERKQQQQAFKENADRLTTNRVTERRGRVSELRTMSNSLGENLTKEGATLAEITPVNRTRAVVAESNVALAELQGANQVAAAARDMKTGVEGALQVVGEALEKTVDSSQRARAAALRAMQRIDALEAQIKDHRNR